MLDGLMRSLLNIYYEPKLLSEIQSRNSIYKNVYLHRKKHIINALNCTLIMLKTLMTQLFIFLVFLPDT